MLKTNIEIVTGFISSGKTNFINALLCSTLMSSEKVIVIQCEDGNSAIKEEFLKNKNLRIRQIDFDDLKEELLIKYIKGFKPYRIIIEHNSMENMGSLIEKLNSRELLKISSITTIFNIIDGKSFLLYLYNMGGVIIPALERANLIIINNIGELGEGEKDKLLTTIEKINNHGFILPVNKSEDLKKELENFSKLDRGVTKKISLFLKNKGY
ncbi:GTP-binding protein [Clostridium sp. UBA6640]|uniref:GTP-binding protein n=1 Tax=Clostridium sp. UBA6640 TaxID=1946370 RepID=UPI0025C034AC|nr:GTP-binding protein [Clostridium sp. UBA6640]